MEEQHNHKVADGCTVAQALCLLPGGVVCSVLRPWLRDGGREGGEKEREKDKERREREGRCNVLKWRFRML